VASRSIPYFGPEDITAVPKKRLVERVKNAYTLFSRGEAVNPPRQVFWVEGNWWGVMSSYLPANGVSVKVVNIIEANRRRGLPTINGLVSFFDYETGLPKAIYDAPTLTAYRTAAGSMVSVELLAPEKPRVAAIIGCGYQATIHMEFMAELIPSLERLRLYDAVLNRASKLAVKASKYFSRVNVEETPLKAVEDADIVLLATTARRPAINGEWLEPPVHVISIGVMGPDHRELDETTLRLAEIIAVDSFNAVMEEVADLRLPLESGVIDRSKIVEIGALAEKGYERGDGITVFKSVGIAVQDAAIASLLLELER